MKKTISLFIILANALFVHSASFAAPSICYFGQFDRNNPPSFDHIINPFVDGAGNNTSQIHFLNEIDHLHLDGRQLANEFIVEKIAAEANKNKISISIELKNSRFVERYRERIFAFLETYTPLLLLDEKEAFALTRLLPEQSVKFLNYYCPLAVIKMEHGCWVGYKSEARFIPAPEASPNENAFNDYFLSSYLKGFSPETCAHMGFQIRDCP